MLIGGGHYERPCASKLFMKKPHRVVFPIVGTKRIRTDEFRETVGLVRVRRAERPHLVQDDRRARRRDLMRSFRPGESGTNDMNGGWANGLHGVSSISER
jgi:hypothetical protein